MDRSTDRKLADRSLSGYFVYTILLVAFTLLPDRDHTIGLGFVFVSLLLLWGRLHLHYRCDALRDQHPERWRLLFGGGAALSSLLWSTYMCMWLVHDGLTAITFMMLLCSTGLTAGAAYGLSPDLRLMRVYVVLSVLPVIGTTLIWGGNLGVVVAGLTFFQGIFHWVQGNRAHRDYWRALTDHTLLENREEALMRSQRDLRQVIERNPDGVAIFRGDELVYVNPAWAALVGPQVPGKQVFRRGEVQIEREDGHAVTLEIAEEQALDFEGMPATLIVARDVTERKKLQARLMLADRMASIGTLSAGVAHEINNPLAFVTANLGLIAEELPAVVGELPAAKLPELLQIVADARQGAERVERIVRDLKTFSRGDDERRGAVDLHRVLDGAAGMAGNEIRHRARLVKDYGDVPPVYGNEGRLGQLFLNLLINAAQAIPPGRAEANEIRIATRATPTGVEIEIHDTGCGIPARALGRIFEPFFTTKPVGLGTGLGLSICHGIVSSFGGEITVESSEGAGTRFRVVLRAGEDAPSPSSPVVAAPLSRGPLRLLIIDDEPVIVSTLKRALASEHEVAVAASGRDALALLDAPTTFDVVLCDLMMPEVTGMDLYEAVAKRVPELLPRLVFMTGGAFTPQAQAFLERVPNRCLEKPIDIVLLRKTVHDVAMAAVPSTAS